MSPGVSESPEKMEPPQFAYLPPPSESLYGYKEEGLKEKFIRKTKENPAVPFGKSKSKLKRPFFSWLHNLMFSSLSYNFYDCILNKKH